LTEQGVAFASLKSPILDAKDKLASSALSDEEAEFLATHIKTWVPTEWHDMRAVLEAIAAGKASPNEVVSAVRSELPSQWTDSMTQTHVSGVIARLGDIRLLRRSWQGRNVHYELGANDTVTSFMTTLVEGRS
jgi:DNA-binding transcriptional ArsR family regulator